MGQLTSAEYLKLVDQAISDAGKACTALHDSFYSLSALGPGRPNADIVQSAMKNMDAVRERLHAVREWWTR